MSKFNYQIVHKGETGKIRFAGQRRLPSQIFIYLYISIILTLFSVLVLRLFQLTIVKGEYYRRLSEENRIRELLIEPKRGKIIDRKGSIIAENDEADTEKNTDRLTSSRLYHVTDSIAHLIGYRQKADKYDMRDDSCLYRLKIGDKVGKKSVEKLFECQLRGKHGKKLVEVDARGSYLRTLSLLPSTDGHTIQLGLDLELQKKAFEMIKNQKGAVVGMKPQTGEVMILASTPSFNPQEFENENEESVSSYLRDEDKPLFNRSTEGTYAPGSVFKLVLAAGVLEEKKIDEKTLFEDTGILKAGPLTFGNWYFLQYGKTDGMVDIVKAIRRSNDIFFYKTGDLLTPSKIKKWAEVVGYGQKTGIGITETEGLVPSPFWKEETIKDRWYLGDTYNLSIGQGFLLVTPLQINQATAVFANGGYLCKPELLKVSSFAKASEDKQNCKKLPISEKTLSLIRQGMKEACSPGGTGWPLFDFKPQVGCKTGTAESQGKETSPHAWFTIFAPYDNPEIVLTVLIEEGGQGSDVAAPIAKDILKTYFERSE